MDAANGQSDISSRLRPNLISVLRDRLSARQFDIATGDGNALVTACPGSGKTRTVAARAAWLDSSGKRVALASYTNVGADEIASTAARMFNCRLGPEHYNGTLHGMLVRYVIRPFGHLEMGCSVPPRIQSGVAGEKFWENRKPIDPNTFSLQSDGTVSGGNHYHSRDWPGGHEAYLEQLTPRVVEAKFRQAAAGYVHVNDILYWSWRILERHEFVANALAMRFDEVVVDEAQDTNEMQTACLRLLLESGLGSLVLVGDLDQSIFGFAGATPGLAKSLMEDFDLEDTRLDENWRSSQLICGVTALLRNAAPDIAKGEFAGDMFQPSIIGYDPGDPLRTVEEFGSMLDFCGIKRSESGVLVRDNSMRLKLGRPGPSIPKTLGGASHFLDLVINREVAPSMLSLRGAESALRDVLGATARGVQMITESSPLEIRALVLEVAENLPHSQVALDEWVSEYQTVVCERIEAHYPGSDPCLEFPYIPKNIASTPVDEFAASSAQGGNGINVMTFHGAKGKTLQGALLVASAEPYEDELQADLWASCYSRARTEAVIDVSEECRILYVGISRAQRILQIAVPLDTSARAIDNFARAGYDVSSFKL